MDQPDWVFLHWLSAVGTDSQICLREGPEFYDMFRNVCVLKKPILFQLGSQQSKVFVFVLKKRPFSIIDGDKRTCADVPGIINAGTRSSLTTPFVGRFILEGGRERG